MICISCTTNIDAAKRLKWPNELPARPNVGDRIRSTSSTATKYIELEVVCVTWVKASETSWSIPEGQWYLEVELHLPKHRWVSIHDFENWVNRP